MKVKKYFLPLLFLLSISPAIESIAGDSDLPHQRQFNKFDTRLGVVEIIGLLVKEDDGSIFPEPPDRITVDGQEVFSDTGYYIDVYKILDLGDRVAVLFGVNAGGSATPNDNQLYFLLLKDGQKPTIATTDQIIL